MLSKIIIKKRFAHTLTLENIAGKVFIIIFKNGVKMIVGK